MSSKAYIVSIPRSITTEDILQVKPELRSYIEDLVEDQSYSQLDRVLDDLKTNMETYIMGNISCREILYFIVDYARESNNLLGEISIHGDHDLMINIESKDIKEDTRQYVIRNGLLDGIIGNLRN